MKYSRRHKKLVFIKIILVIYIDIYVYKIEVERSFSTVMFLKNPLSLTFLIKKFEVHRNILYNDLGLLEIRKTQINQRKINTS